MSHESDAAFRHAVARARGIEQMVAAWLMSRGWGILPVYDYCGLAEGKAPKLQGRPDSFVVPDLLVAKAGQTRWAEVKYKTHADFTRCTRRMETGIDRRLWNHYMAVQQMTGLPVWIIFVHEREDEIRGDSLAGYLGRAPRYYDAAKMGRSGMVFFSYSDIPMLATLSAVRSSTGTSAPCYGAAHETGLRTSRPGVFTATRHIAPGATEGQHATIP